MITTQLDTTIKAAIDAFSKAHADDNTLLSAYFSRETLEAILDKFPDTGGLRFCIGLNEDGYPTPYALPVQSNNQPTQEVSDRINGVDGPTTGTFAAPEQQCPPMNGCGYSI